MTQFDLINHEEFIQSINKIPEDKKVILFKGKFKAQEQVSLFKIQEIKNSWKYLFGIRSILLKFNDDNIESIGYQEEVPDFL